MIDGSMQDFPLTLDRILDHAAKWHPENLTQNEVRDFRLLRVSWTGA